jgi:hypothetical protein
VALTWALIRSTNRMASSVHQSQKQTLHHVLPFSRPTSPTPPEARSRGEFLLLCFRPAKKPLRLLIFPRWPFCHSRPQPFPTSFQGGSMVFCKCAVPSCDPTNACSSWALSEHRTPSPPQSFLGPLPGSVIVPCEVVLSHLRRVM